MAILLEGKSINDYDNASKLEWIETNGLGGWASSTVSGANSRRYHGLLVAATKPPVGRAVLLSKLEECIVTDNNEAFDFATNQFPGSVSPLGFMNLEYMKKDLFPEFCFRFGKYRVKRTYAAVHGENTTLILYQVLDAPASFTFVLRPFIAFRDFHSLTTANNDLRWFYETNKDTLELTPYPGMPTLRLKAPGAKFNNAPGWYHGFEYLEELHRGLDCKEDLFSHGYYTIRLKKGDTFGIIASTEDTSAKDAFKLFDAETKRRQALLSAMPHRDEFTDMLTLAADQFVVRRGSGLKTVIAGYHWFSDWGRDTMISLSGLTLVTGRHQDAKLILKAFADATDKGMIPNRFPDIGEEPEYNTVDATLWYFVAIWQYLQYSGDMEFVSNTLLPVLEDIVSWHKKGTRYNIKEDADGLISAGESGQQLTWMDAKVDHWVVTPRTGKAVEINALWYNALCIMKELYTKLGDETKAKNYDKAAKKTQKSFLNLYWNEEMGYLADCVEGTEVDYSIRPNQIFALSLPFPLLDKKKGQSVVDVVEKHLLTPVGLRSLSADDGRYCPHYFGDRWSRDGAYHQGTVWGWLLGPFYSAKVRFGTVKQKKEVEAHFRQLQKHMTEAGLGTISEIFDGDAPHKPNGCMAQAWSVAEVLRAYLEDIKGVTLTSSERISSEKA